MFKKAIAAWATFWTGVLVAIGVAVFVNWKAGVAVFIVATLVAIVLMVKTFMSVSKELDPFTGSNSAHRLFDPDRGAPKKAKATYRSGERF